MMDAVDQLSGEKKPFTKDDCFAIRNDHVFFTEYSEDEGEQKAPIKVCGALQVTARTRNEKGSNHGRLLEFCDKDEKKKVVAIPCADLQADGLDVRKLLSSMGLYIRPNNKSRQLLTEYILESNPDKVALCVARTGWNDGAYILPNQVIGEKNVKVVYQPENGEHKSDIDQAGTLEQWQILSGLCAGNSRLVFALGCAFAAPLLRLLNEPGGGFNFFGSSSDGKSTALYIAASVYGDPAKYHRKWNSTRVGFEYLAYSRNDALLALDELGEGDGKQAGKTAYMLADGIGRTRGQGSGGMRDVPTWKLITLSTGEVTLEQQICESGATSRAGQQVRMVDIPADAGKGYKVFECLHGFELDEEGNKRGTDLAGQMFSNHLNELCHKHYGSVLVPYIKAIAETYAADPVLFQENYARYRDDFLNHVVPDNANSQVRRVAQRFALIAYAGVLATKVCVTGWDESEAIDSATTCFKAWVDHRGGVGSQEESFALSQVRYYLDINGKSSFVWLNDDGKHKPNEMAGYKRIVNGRMEYLMFPEVFKREVCQGLNQKKVEGYCVDAGLLVPESSGRPTTRVRVEGVQKRLYVFVEELQGGERDD